MKRTIVVTGSSRGIGLGMAQAFARSGCQVVVNGRSTRAVEAAIQTLPEALRGDALGIAADIGSLEQAQHLWDTAVARFGRVDVWINNAGLIAPRPLFIESGTRWVGDARIHVALITWILALGAVFLRTVSGWRGRKAALLCLVLMGCAAMTWAAHVGLRPVLEGK